MEQKRGLVEACKHWVAEVSAAEQVLALDVRRVRAEGEEELERDRRAFKAGAEDRRNRAIARRQQEIREETRRAMEPEFQRMRRNHDAQMQELNVRLAAEEKALRDSYESVLAERIADEERALKATSQTRSRQMLDAATCEHEAAEAAHKDEMRRVVRDAKSEIESARTRLHHKLESEKARLKDELMRAQHEGQAQLDALAAAHRAEVQRIHDEHDELVQQLKARDAAQREAAEKDFETETRVIRMQQDQLLRSPKRGSGGAEGSFLPPDVQAARDARLQDEIKRAETETVRQLRLLKARVETERSSIIMSAETELAARLKRRLKFENEAADLSARKEEFTTALKTMKSDLRDLEARRCEAERELEALLSSLSAADAARQQREEAERKRLQGELASRQAHAEAAEARLRDLQRQLQDADRSQADEADAVEINFNRTLEELDANVRLNYLTCVYKYGFNECVAAMQVKREVARLEDEAEGLRDAVQTERVRCERLRKILRSYGGAAAH
jgi:hypothetical protein